MGQHGRFTIPLESAANRPWPMRMILLLMALMVLIPVINEASEPLRKMARNQRDIARGLEPKPIMAGALGRWRNDIQAFWKGENIYLPIPSTGQQVTGERDGWPVEHPNMPLVVVLLTPFVLLPAPAIAGVYALIKLIAWVVSLLMVLQLISAKHRLLGGGAALLAFVAAWKFFNGDISHANTNIFTAFFIVLHLWLYHHKHDIAAGTALAMAICLKLTPALFAVYWLYQRQWKLLITSGVAFIILTLSPALILGWQRLVEDLLSWWTYVIRPATLGGSWWPTNNNQSLHGMIARLFIGGLRGNYLMDVDLPPTAQPAFASIAIYDLGPVGAKYLLWVLQSLLLIISGWAIGWRRMNRDDPRRMLHFGVISALMLLLSQRTWDHHAVHLMIAHFAAIYAIFCSRLDQRTRTRCGWVFVAGLLWLMGTSGDLLRGLFGRDGMDRLDAWGSSFWHFVVMWMLCLILTAKLRRLDDPYLPAGQSAT